MKKKLAYILFLVICFVAEAGYRWNFLKEITPFPWAEFWYHTLNYFLRDVLLSLVALLLYARRKRIPDRLHRYFPVAVTGALYLLDALFMVTYLELDPGFMTTLSVLAGLFNNIVLVLLAAMIYHHWPNRLWKAIYFLVFYVTCVLILGDGIYFWNTSMHVESVLFDNLNIYAAKGILATTENWQLGLIGVILLLFIPLFRVSTPRRHKPNLPWSLLLVALFTMVLNGGYWLLAEGVYLAIDNTNGLDIEVDMEKSRRPTRTMVAYPINVNFFQKAFFKTDKVVQDPWKFQERELTDKDVAELSRLGILPKGKPVPLEKPAYDRVVMLILESVHRDYLHYYNPNIPADATPYLDSLVKKYPHIDHYYSSAVPTTQGLNATFRSQLIYDKDLPGQKQPSLFRSVQQAGYSGYFVNASSRYYANEYREYPAQFGMEHYLAKEDLGNLGYKGASGWGFHNDVMYDFTLKTLAEHRNEKMLLVCKTLDMHQPYPYYGYTYAEMPEDVRDNGTATVCGMYWVDKTIQHFFEEAEKEGLMDDRTLFIVTADHNPHSGGEYKKLVDNPQDKQSVAPIPVIFISKNLQPLKDLEESIYASQQDMAPTLLSLLALPTPDEFMGRNLLQPGNERSYALGYFGGKAYYYSQPEYVVATLDEEHPDTEAKDAIANYLMYGYVKRHLEFLQK
ncbi:LTA synthase family protein [Acidaminococcus timonensis]|uniref:LTA synthase family protein n=1 Tax=Acidaminococcus timonensis TaxID=1871002 RepID=UPI003A5BCAB7